MKLFLFISSALSIPVIIPSNIQQAKNDEKRKIIKLFQQFQFFQKSKTLQGDLSRAQDDKIMGIFSTMILAELVAETETSIAIANMDRQTLAVALRTEIFLLAIALGISILVTLPSILQMISRKTMIFSAGMLWWPKMITLHQSCKFEKFSLSWAELSLTDEIFCWAELDRIKNFLSWAELKMIWKILSWAELVSSTS